MSSLEKITCPACGESLEAMDPFYDTEENEWNYHCDNCNLDITVFDKNEEEKEIHRPSYWEVIAWISDHELLWQDFKSFFNVSDEDMGG